MSGILYGVGLGPGDPSLLTLKAVDTLKKCEIIAAPHTGSEDNIALNIIKDYLDGKEILKCETPMSKDKSTCLAAYDRAAETICKYLDEGKDVCFITLGDPSIYSTYMYIHHIVSQKNYETKLIPGVTSFCAVAATLSISLCEGKEALHIIPASYEAANMGLDLPGTKVLMKSGSQLKDIIALLEKNNLLNKAQMIQSCTMPQEKIFKDMNNLEELDINYFTTIIVKGDK